MTKASRRKTTLVIVDVQQSAPVPPGIVEKIRRYARRFDRRVFTRFVNPPDSLFRKTLGLKCCAPGSAGTRLLIEPGPRDMVMEKSGYGLKPADLRRLHSAGIKQVTVCGLDTDACVMGVMFSLFDAHIDCRVKEDLCWSSSGLHGQAMKIIATQFPPPKRRRR